ncbi:homoserine O-succinyltransferase [Fidelibacter multiformis]|jgi:homoserine O-succinyltransferase|uniref:homoserine O-acetyltransferase MetA n=1 Tax=Fidelibacter multiformis TaxID=3377529 RepID=UPI0037DD0510
MPVNVPDKLPAIHTLRKENIFVMTESRATHQDIRPLRLLVLNLMPLKIVTETDLIRMLSNTPLQVELELLHMSTHISKNTPREHLEQFYHTFGDIREHRYDGMIITGAPVETLPFEEVTYWRELQSIMDWTTDHVTSTLYLCWAAQAGLHHFYGIPKYPLEKKCFGIFPHTVLPKTTPLFHGFDDCFMMPHSRHTEIRKEDILSVPNLKILAISPEAGLGIIATKNGKQIFITGHPEYSANTLKKEYERDKAAGLPIEIPKNYFPEDNPSNHPRISWRAHASLLFSNWLNYYVYQETPYVWK